MKRPAFLSFAVIALLGLVAVPSQAASPTFFFEKGYDAVSFWRSTTATEQTTTVVIFFTADRGPRPRDHTTTLLSYFSQTETWDGTQWQLTSTTSALAHSDNADVISYAIEPGSRAINASATGQAMQCTPSFPNCTPLGPVQLQASWLATGSAGPPEGSPGHHITDWTGSGCDIDFRSGRTISLPASATATINGTAVTGVQTFASIESFQGVEVKACLSGA